MNCPNQYRIFLAAALTFLGVTTAQSQPAPFSAQAAALPFPPDAREVEFDATFDGIEFESGSSLAALADFYRKELAKRGWTEDKSATEQDDESIEMTFQHDGSQIVLELYAGSDDVSVSFDCEGIDFSQTSDPAKMMAAGVPQPRSYLYLQKELPRPADIRDVEYQSDECHFKSPLALQAAFDFYAKALKASGWRESRKPIITGDRRYTEYQRRGDEVSVNVFTDEVGSRIILGYENEIKEPTVPPLPEPLGSLASNSSGTGTKGDDPTKGTTAPTAPARIGVDVSKNTGSATFTLNGKAYPFKHVAAYREKNDSAETTRLLFTDGPIPLARMQELLTTEDTLMMSDLYPQDWPGHLMINVGQYSSFTFNDGGIGIGNSIETPENKLKEEKGRVRGTIRMLKPQEAFDEQYLLEATVDAAILTSQTQLTSETRLGNR